MMMEWIRNLFDRCAMYRVVHNDHPICKGIDLIANNFDRLSLDPEDVCSECFGFAKFG